MKQIMYLIGFLLGSFLLFSSFSLRENPQDPPRGDKGEKVKRHIRLEKIENGKKTVLDTVINGNQVFVWNGDTIGSARELRWNGIEGFEPDSIHKNFEFRFLEPDEEGNKRFMFAPHAPTPPMVPHVIKMNKKPGGNLIDLGGPGIISYKKKKMSGGREKITIIRNEPSENDVMENVLIHIPDVPEPAVWMHPGGPEKMKAVKVIKRDNGETKIYEYEDVKEVEGNKKVMIVREKAEKGQKNLEIETKENEENK